MEVKVGQVWKNKLGHRLEIIGISKTDFAWKMDDGEIGCTLLKYWDAIQEPTLLSNSPLSDLEILQKAVGKTDGTLTIYTDGSSSVSFIFEEDFVCDTPQELLTWAKQTIGDES